MCFESAYGKFLCVEPDGKVVADRSWGNSWEQFRLEKFSDPGAHGGRAVAGGADRDACGGRKGLAGEAGGYPSAAALKAEDRFVLRTSHGEYLR